MWPSFGYFSTVIYRKVASSSLSRLVAHFQIVRRLMKEKFDAYVLWPLAKIVKGQFKRLKSPNSFFDQTSMLLYFKFPRGKKIHLLLLHREIVVS